MTTPPFSSSSVLENPLALMSAGPAPGVQVVREIHPGRIMAHPLAAFGFVNADDTPWLQTAHNYLQQKYGAGIVELGPFNTFNLKSQLTMPWQNSMIGVRNFTTLNVVGNITGIFRHNLLGVGGQFGLPAEPTGGRLDDIIIDGTNATGTAVGLDMGDAWGYETNVTVQNFTSPSTIGIWAINRKYFTEKCRFILHLLNNQNPLIFDSNNTANDHSFEYNQIETYLFAQANQNGIVAQGGANFGGCMFIGRGNMSTASSPAQAAAVAYLTVTGQDPSGAFSRFYNSLIHIKIEGNTGNGDGVDFPNFLVLGAAGNQFKQCLAIMGHSLNNSVIPVGSEFTVRGQLNGDTQMAAVTTPALPASGVTQDNFGPDATMCISGGTVTNISVGGVSTGLTSGSFLLPAGSSYSISYSVAPSVWQWVPASRSVA